MHNECFHSHSSDYTKKMKAIGGMRSSTQAVIIFLLRCSVNSLKFLALTCSLILTRLQTKLQ